MKFIRLETNQPLSEDDIELVFDAVEEHAQVEFTTALDDDGEVISDEVAVMVYEGEGDFTYEVRVSDDTDNDSVDAIVRLLDHELDASVDFRFELAQE